mmetsp:Transcript_3528/g.10973  ORF Transcript_3528/g.10973 Transcript_3528/m.10973 type:complete len:264 (+) Transcript_3528:779-1570(+)
MDGCRRPRVEVVQENVRRRVVAQHDGLRGGPGNSTGVVARCRRHRPHPGASDAFPHRVPQGEHRRLGPVRRRVEAERRRRVLVVAAVVDDERDGLDDGVGTVDEGERLPAHADEDRPVAAVGRFEARRGFPLGEARAVLGDFHRHRGPVLGDARAHLPLRRDGLDEIEHGVDVATDAARRPAARVPRPAVDHGVSVAVVRVVEVNRQEVHVEGRLLDEGAVARAEVAEVAAHLEFRPRRRGPRHPERDRRTGRRSHRRIHATL